MEYTFYKISHAGYPELLYIGSIKDFQKRKIKHKSDCYNENLRTYNVQLYQFIRENNINYDSITIEIIERCFFKTRSMLIKKNVIGLKVIILKIMV